MLEICSYAVSESAVVDDTSDEEVAENEPETSNPSLVFPELVNDSVKEHPAIIVMSCTVPSAAKVLGDGLHPLTVTVPAGAEPAMVTVMGCDTDGEKTAPISLHVWSVGASFRVVPRLVLPEAVGRRYSTS